MCYRELQFAVARKRSTDGRWGGVWGRGERSAVGGRNEGGRERERKRDREIDIEGMENNYFLFL